MAKQGSRLPHPLIKWASGKDMAERVMVHESLLPRVGERLVRVLA